MPLRRGEEPGATAASVRIFKKPFTASAVTNEEFAVDKFVSRYLISFQKPGETLGVGSPSGQGPNPYGGVHQNHLGYMTFGGWIFTTARHVLGVRL